MNGAPSLPLCLALAAAGAAPAARPAAAQQAPAVVAVGVSPDTVRVGEPFVLGVRVRARDGTEVLFPPTIGSGEEVEQVRPFEVTRADAKAGEWRAYYRLVAWRPGEVMLPDLAIRLADAGGAREVSAAGPPVVVRSVLPSDTAGLELRAPRPPLPARALTWLWILLALLAALLLWAWLRRRAHRREAPRVTGESPAQAALRSLAALRAEVEAGRIAPRQGYDRMEAILRGYLEATRAWPPGAPLRAPAASRRPPRAGRAAPAAGAEPAGRAVPAAGPAPAEGAPLPGGSGWAERVASGPAPAPEALGDGLLEPLRRSALVRFARLGVEAEEVAADAAACSRWVRRDARPERTGEPDPRASDRPDRGEPGGAERAGRGGPAREAPARAEDG